MKEAVAARAGTVRAERESEGEVEHKIPAGDFDAYSAMTVMNFNKIFLVV